MAVPKVVSGQRVVVKQLVPNQPARTVGIYSRAGYAVTYDQQGAWVLGRLTAASIDLTAVELVQINATGWRVVGHGAHVDGGVPKLQDLLLSDYLTFIFLDRATGTVIAKVEQCRPSGYSTEFAIKQLTEMPQSFVGILATDESGSQGEDGVNPVDASDLP